MPFQKSNWEASRFAEKIKRTGETLNLESSIPGAVIFSPVYIVTHNTGIYTTTTGFTSFQDVVNYSLATCGIEGAPIRAIFGNYYSAISVGCAKIAANLEVTNLIYSATEYNKSAGGNIWVTYNQGCWYTTQGVSTTLTMNWTVANNFIIPVYYSGITPYITLQQTFGVVGLNANTSTVTVDYAITIYDSLNMAGYIL